MSGDVVKSHANSNRELVKSFVRYMESRYMAKATMTNYEDCVKRLVERFGSRSVCEAQSSDLRNFLAGLMRQGLCANSIRARTAALRCFFKFLRLGSLVSIDPMRNITHRKLPKRLPLVLTLEEVERIIAAARTPFERAVVEVLYSTGVRVSELVNIRMENITSAERMILIERGKGGKDRYVLYGKHAAEAMAEYQAWRPSENGYLFEPRGRHRKSYGTRQIGALVKQIGHRAGVNGVHPHSFRRAMACHMLANGSGIRVIQELLGHAMLTTTMIYTTLTDEKLQEIHQRYHPHAQES